MGDPVQLVGAAIDEIMRVEPEALGSSLKSVLQRVPILVVDDHHVGMVKPENAREIVGERDTLLTVLEDHAKGGRIVGDRVRRCGRCYRGQTGLRVERSRGQGSRAERRPEHHDGAAVDDLGRDRLGLVVTAFVVVGGEVDVRAAAIGVRLFDRELDPFQASLAEGRLVPAERQRSGNFYAPASARRQ